jgi:hypothetical protein
LTERTGDTLTGMKAIANYTGLGEDTIVSLIRNCGFPARQTADRGLWISNKQAIDKWSFVFSTMRGADHGE